MKFVAIALLAALAGCGPQINDKDKSSFNANNMASNNGAANNSAGQTTSGNNGTSGSNTTGTTSGNNGTTSGNNGTTSGNNGTTSGNNTGNNNTSGNNTTGNNTVDPVAEKCAAACDVLWGRCVDTLCNLPSGDAALIDELERGCKGTGGDAGELCTARYRSESAYRTLVDDLAANPSCNNEIAVQSRCFDLGSDVCTGCPTPTLGTPCTTDGQCDGGLLPGVCQPEQGDGSWFGGACLAGGCQFGSNPAGSLVVGGGTGCGDEGVCYAVDSSNSVCFERCNQNNDCERRVTGPNQSGYSCTSVGTIGAGADAEFLGVCQPACGDSYPCEVGFVCGATYACEVECSSDFDCPEDFACSGSNSNGESYCRYSP